jgi:DNA-binding transcriptional MerR regulator
MSPRDAQLPRNGRDYFPTRDVVDILGISRRQLQYWAKTGLVAPSAATPGGHRRYSFADLVALKTTKRLIDSGVSVQRIRESICALRERLPRIEVALADLVLVATGDVVLIFPATTSYEAVAGHEWVFEVAAFAREVQAWRHALEAKPHRTARAVRRPSEQAASPQGEQKRESMQTG